jgi:signal transduction histidine kinase
MLGVVVPIALVIGTFSYFDYTRRRQKNNETLSMFAAHIGGVILNDLRHQMIESDFEGLQELLITIGQLEGVNAVYLLNTKGEVIFGSDEAILGTYMSNQSSECLVCHQFETTDRPNSTVVMLAGGERVYRSARIIDNEAVCQDCHTEDTEHLGILLTDLSVAPYEASLFYDTRYHFLWWSAALFLTLGVVGFVFNRFVLLRLNAIGRQIQFVGEGQDVSRLPDHPRDEIGRIATAFNQMVSRLEEREADNAQLSASLKQQNEQRGQLLNRLITAQEQERQRVAREIHDVLGQSLSGLAFRTQALRRYFVEDSGQADPQITKIENLIQHTIDKMYSMILDLRPSVLDDLGLLPALRGHAERTFQPVGIQYSIETDGINGRLPPEIETTFYRTIQEALNNIVRHARATRVQITLKQLDGCYEGEIIDNGVGFDLEAVDLSGDSPRGLGILGMKERVAQAGGELNVFTTPGAGTRIQVHLYFQTGEDG